MADQFIQITPGADFEVLTTLRALVQGKEIEAGAVGGVPRIELLELAKRMKACRYGVVFMGMGLTMSGARDYNVHELFTLVGELNQYTRFSVMPMRGHGNVAGADQVLTWQSGYPFAVSFARGYPQYSPGEFSTVDVLAREEVDAALILASDPVAHLPRVAGNQLKRIPTIVLYPMMNLTSESAQVFFPTGCYGVDAAGTCYRVRKHSLDDQITRSADILVHPIAGSPDRPIIRSPDGIMTFPHAILLFTAAVLAGAMNSVAGGGSFFSFPALIFTGVPPIPANATNTVAVWPGSVASVFSYWKRLPKSPRIMVPMITISIIGGGQGPWCFCTRRRPPSCAWFRTCSESPPCFSPLASGLPER